MGLKGLYLVAMNTTKASGLQTLGFDCVGGVPAHQVAKRSINDDVAFLMSEQSARVYSYADVVEARWRRSRPAPRSGRA